MSEKTEQPTPKKQRDAREKGQVAYSKDFTKAMLTVSLLGYLVMRGDVITEQMQSLMLAPAAFLHLPFREALAGIYGQMSTDAMALLAPFILIVIIVGMASDIMQVGLVLAFEAAKPSGDKINPATNLKNIFSKRNLVEFIKSLIKVIVLGVVVMHIVKSSLPGLVTLPSAGVSSVGIASGILLKALLIPIGFVFFLIAGADLLWQRYSHNKELMMSKDEVDREYKEMEGDQDVKQHRKSLHRELLEEDAVERSQSASVLVTNPTHFAIALYYVQDETPLPLILAKGEDQLAQRMIDAARRKGVPIMRNVPLARALWAEGSVDQYIPSTQIAPVAEVIRVVLNMRNEGRL
ncbi:type III secretion protein [Pandoraea pnomenusa]|uniref:Yop proteins translocation protein U n=1 Tax=Pandoraea pnomenusa TaxID=93220 RepID=A0A378YVT8_9BURK|nr:type III secretion system export apparatus subunit SctU [Pandoraea pnomenusa]AHB07180.1 type III secretion protein [Pandoraea pnomenusa 3kgm]AIU28468.1 type III secretion protein [Pandoraea pnomenusa]SUA80657.1 Yop proteins translocation protein U [Pandoraea pnomenusa]